MVLKRDETEPTSFALRLFCENALAISKNLTNFNFILYFSQFQAKDESLQLNYVSSQKGKYQLAYRGFYYVREKVVNNKVYWRCIEYTSKLRCHARIHTVGDNIVRDTPHCHDPIKAKKKVFWIADTLES